jgi:hypothetical protein
MPGYDGISFLETNKKHAIIYQKSSTVNAQQKQGAPTWKHHGHTHVIISTPEAERALQLHLPIKTNVI